ncbi:Protein of unknown function [Lactobacillus delbrueckii subsp. lactis]|nr:Protein of unknown function [Lactobacillus delbrueckii subsp. lactis]
MEKLLAKARTT